MLCIHAEDGPAIGGDVAQAAEMGLEAFCGGEVRCENQIVNFPDFAVFFVNVADFSGEEETDFGVFGSRELIGFFETEETVFGRFEFFLEFGEPGRMREVAGSDDGNAFETRPIVQMFRDQKAAGGDGIMGMDVQICNKQHFRKVPSGLDLDVQSRSGAENIDSIKQATRGDLS